MHDVARLILETRHLRPPSERNAALLVDADLSVFGADDEACWDYEAAVRQAYDWVDWPTCRADRTAVPTESPKQQQMYAEPECRTRRRSAAAPGSGAYTAVGSRARS